MSYDPEQHHRRSIRLTGYDYTQAGAYFVTICVQGQACLLGDVVDGEMALNEAGHMVVRCWNKIPERFLNIELDEFITMPNHVHGIMVIASAQSRRAPTRGAPTLGSVVGAFKSITTNQYIRGVRRCRWAPFKGRFWQRNYYEHIIRNERELVRIREYIATNPARWDLDRENPKVIAPPAEEDYYRKIWQGA